MYLRYDTYIYFMTEFTTMNVLLHLINEEVDDEDDLLPRQIRRPRHFRDLTNPLTNYTDDQIYARYQFKGKVIIELTDLLKPELERPKKRNRAVPVLIQVCIFLRLANSWYVYTVYII